MITSINGKEATWPAAIEALWHAHTDGADPKFFTGCIIERANYFTPRPRVDEYNRGSNRAGFVYVRRAVNDAGVPKVYDCSWIETYDPALHDRYRR